MEQKKMKHPQHHQPGTALFWNTLYIYYGAADEQGACASLSLSALLAELLTYTIRDEK